MINFKQLYPTISFVNTIMEACHHLPNTNIDEVTNGLKLATRRLISGAYLSGGMASGVLGGVVLGSGVWTMGHGWGGMRGEVWVVRYR